MQEKQQEFLCKMNTSQTEKKAAWSLYNYQHIFKEQASF